MKKIPIYKYKRPDGGTTVSPIRPEHGEYKEMYRIVADEGKILRKGKYGIELNSIEVDNDEGWEEYEDMVLDEGIEETQLTKDTILEKKTTIIVENVDSEIEELIRENNKLKNELKHQQEKVKSIDKKIGALSTSIQKEGKN